MNIAKYLLAMFAGAAIGSLATYYMTKDAMEEEKNAEIDSMKEYYQRKAADTEKKINDYIEQNTKKEDEDTAEIKEYKEATKRYVNYSSLNEMPEIKEAEKKAREEKLATSNSPYVIIDRSEYGRDKSYDQIELDYYMKDDTLVRSETANEDDDEICNPDVYIGFENLRIFEESGESVLYVRNDRLSAYFEVNKLDGAYDDVSE